MKLNKDLVAAYAAPLILSILEDGESYGYAILERVRALSDGAVEWTDGMLYPVLHRLEASLSDNPRRVVIAYLAYTAAIEPVVEMLAAFSWLRRTRYEESVRGHYNWLLYTN